MEWRNAPSLTALRAFDATARRGSFAEAARALNVTHAAVAQQVRGLERELGVRLATRQGRQVRLTDQGRALAAALASGFGIISEELDRLRDAGRSRALRVTTTPFLAERVIMPKLSQFWTMRPGAEISLHPSRDFVDVVGQGFDLAIRAVLPGSDPGGSDVEVAPVARVSLICIAAAGLARLGIDDLHDLPWLWHDGMGTKIELMTACGIDCDRLTRRPIGSPNLLLEAVRQGVGVTIFNEAIARDEIARGGIVEVPLPREAHVDYIAILPKGPPHPLAEPFVDWVRTLI